MSRTPVDPYALCPCGSGAKYKFCCRDKERAVRRADAPAGDFTRERFDELAAEIGIKEKLGDLGADEIFRMARQMHENQRTCKTRRLTQLETQVEPKLPEAAIELSEAYPKPERVRMRGGFLRQGEPISREWIVRTKQDPAWMEGAGRRELVAKTSRPLLEGWEAHLTGALRLPREDVVAWRPLLEDFLLRYLVAYEGMLATDIGKKANIIRQYLGNFYPRKFMDCDLESLYQALKGLASFYVYLYHLGLLDLDKARGVVTVCEDHEFFRRRLEGYFRSEGEEMHRWASDWDYDATMIDDS